MNIAILNEVFLTPKHIAELQKLGTVTIYEHTKTDEEVIERLKGVEIAIADCWEAPLNKRVLENIPETKYLTIGSTGYDLVDVAAAKDNGVVVSNIPGFSTEAVAEHTFALLLATVRHIVEGDKAMRTGPFQIDPASKEQVVYKGVDLRGKTLGVVGLGQIGQRIAEIGNAFGMKVVAYNRSQRLVEGVELVTLEDLLRVSDVVSLNVALNDETKETINAQTLSLMKPAAYLINTARGGLINEADLYQALSEKRLAGAGLDLLTNWSKENPLLSLTNVTFSPHTAFFTDEALENLADSIVANVEAYASGSPQSVVS